MSAVASHEVTLTTAGSQGWPDRAGWRFPRTGRGSISSNLLEGASDFSLEVQHEPSPSFTGLFSSRYVPRVGTWEQLYKAIQVSKV